MPTGKNAHKEKCPQGKMPTRKNPHMYNSFKIVAGMSGFVKNSAITEGNITNTSYLNINAGKRTKDKKNNHLCIYIYSI